MNKIIDQAHIVHRTATRLRIRVPARKLDHHYFQNLKANLARCPGVVSIAATPLTGSVLIEHDPGFSLAAFGAVGLALGIQDHRGSRQQAGDYRAVLHRAMAKRDESSDPHLELAKLILAAVTGRLWSHLLDLVVEWCADALIKALLQPLRAPAQVILLPQTRQSRRQAIAAAA